MKRRMPVTVFHVLSAADLGAGGNSQTGPPTKTIWKQFGWFAGAAGYRCLLLVALALASVPPAGAQECVLPSCGQQFSDWSAPINLGPVVKSAGPDPRPAISKDELELYFV